MVAKRFGVYLIALDPAVGREMRKTRPCAVISPDNMHAFLHTVVIVPLTSVRTGWPTRVPCEFGGRIGELALDQIRSVDRARLHRKIGELDRRTTIALQRALRLFFQ